MLSGDTREGITEDIYIANRNFASGGKLYSMHVKPVLIDCNFVVDSANTNGLGIKNLKGPMVQAVYMNTSQTPAAGNPNPAAGTIVVQLSDNYNRVLSSYKSIAAPNSGTGVKIDNSALTAGVGYVISTLGNATAAKWHAIGVPAGVTPAVGVTFIAASDGGTGNTLTSRVMTSAAAGSGVASIEMLGNPNGDISPNPTANQGFGGQLIFECRDYAGALVAPADGSLISLAFLLSDSSILIAGE